MDTVNEGPELPAELTERIRGLSGEVLAIVVAAFREGRSAAVGELGRFCTEVHAELEAEYGALTPESVVHVEEAYQHASPSPAVAAHFGSSAAVLERLRGELRRLGWRESTRP